MGNVIGKKKTFKEILRENKRTISRAVRELDREKSNLEKQEKKIIGELKKAAKENQMGAVKILAKDLVRTRNYITKFIEFRSHLQGVALKLEVVRSQEAMMSAMKDVTKAMVRMNKQVKLPQLQKIMIEFARENERSDLVSELMGDTIDTALGDEGDAEEEDAIVSQVLDEIGINISNAVPAAPESAQKVDSGAELYEKQPLAAAVSASNDQSNNNGPGSTSGGGDPEMSELEARLNNLKRG